MPLPQPVPGGLISPQDEHTGLLHHKPNSLGCLPAQRPPPMLGRGLCSIESLPEESVDETEVDVEALDEGDDWDEDGDEGKCSIAGCA